MFFMSDSGKKIQPTVRLKCLSFTGKEEKLLDQNTGKTHPNKFSLSQNYPNPFNPSTMITYQLPKTSDVEISIYNLLGQKIATLLDSRQNAGKYQVEWDASSFASGIYYYKIQAGEFQDVKKMVVIK